MRSAREIRDEIGVIHSSLKIRMVAGYRPTDEFFVKWDELHRELEAAKELQEKMENPDYWLDYMFEEDPEAEIEEK
jgi:hypothetical protein